MTLAMPASAAEPSMKEASDFVNEQEALNELHMTPEILHDTEPLPEVPGMPYTKIPDSIDCAQCAPHVKAAVVLSRKYPDKFQFQTDGQGNIISIITPNQSLLIDPYTMGQLQNQYDDHMAKNPEAKQEAEQANKENLNAERERQARDLAEKETGQDFNSPCNGTCYPEIGETGGNAADNVAGVMENNDSFRDKLLNMEKNGNSGDSGLSNLSQNGPDQRNFGNRYSQGGPGSTGDTMGGGNTYGATEGGLNASAKKFSEMSPAQQQAYMKSIRCQHGQGEGCEDIDAAYSDPSGPSVFQLRQEAEARLRGAGGSDSPQVQLHGMDRNGQAVRSAVVQTTGKDNAKGGHVELPKDVDNAAWDKSAHRDPTLVKECLNDSMGGKGQVKIAGVGECVERKN